MYDMLRSLLHPEKPASEPLASLITLLTNHFQPKPLETAERFKFYKRKQEPGESVSAYAIALRKLASNGCFEDYLPTALRDQFVMGIASDAVLRRLLTEEDLTIKNAINMAGIIEQASEDANLLHSRLDNTQEAEVDILKLDARARSIPQGKRLSKQEHSHYKCYRCGAATHVATTCRFKDAKCHACGKIGHPQRVCKSTAERSSNRLRDRAKNAYRVQMQESSKDSDEQFPVRNLKIYKIGSNLAAFTVQVLVNGKELTMDLDTDAAVSVISLTDGNALKYIGQ
ncbi:zinc finger CCHC domain-containing 9-like [Pelobates cultripes]|uniref:Zinc finger CCHC domain-containing 9-like n=1 Tax=Pelobates cultripes TaxID=61616 RepID=A0AAD1SGN5_PELCU|nr:zinc finger CCHC domain-containing 9-like [Pelobates cultripes]